MKKIRLPLMIGFLIPIVSCSDNKFTINKLLNETFQEAKISSNIRVDAYSIIGNGLYIQKTKIYSSGIYDDLKKCELENAPADFETLYGGTMMVFSFNENVVKMWNNYLFIESTPYRGSFYEIKTPIHLDSEQIQEEFYSIHIDDGLLATKNNQSISSDELKSQLSNLKCNIYQGNNDFSEPIETISLNGIDDSLIVYSDKVFSVFQSSLLYELNDGCDFSFLQS